MKQQHQADELRAELIKLGYYKTPDKRQLYELSLLELEQIYLNETARLVQVK